MKKKLVKKLALASYVNGVLSEKNVMRIANHLTRSELKAYIKALKQEEQKKTVIVTVPNEKFFLDKKELQEIFTDKHIQIASNSDLLLGIRIQDNDTIYDGNLQSNLEDLVQYINEV